MDSDSGLPIVQNDIQEENEDIIPVNIGDSDSDIELENQNFSCGLESEDDDYVETNRSCGINSSDDPGSADEEEDYKEEEGVSDQAHLACGQWLQSSPLCRIGGFSSTNTSHAKKQASSKQAREIVETIMQSGGDFVSYDMDGEKGDTSEQDIKEVHVHMTQTHIHSPAAIALGGQVIVNPPDSRHSTEMRKLRCETMRKLEKWTEGMITTKGTEDVIDMISQGKPWITISGSPGEGKTTTGYLVLKHLLGLGRQVYEINTPEEYFNAKGKKQPILMLNDIFGSLHFDLGKVRKWEEVLNDVLALHEHRTDDEINIKEKTKHQLAILLISRSTVLRAAYPHLGRFKDLVLNEECVVDLTHGKERTSEERFKIWNFHSDSYKININNKLILEVCKMSLPHGFPHCCRLFASMYSKDKTLNMKTFFARPLEFLNQSMESLMVDPDTGPLLREILRQDGSLDLDSVPDEERRFQYASAVQNLTGTYLSHDNGVVTFHHPSVYDSAAFVVCKKDPHFVIRHCSLSFLNERVRFDGVESGLQTQSQYTVTIGNRYIQPFLARLKTEIENRNLSLALSHQSFHDETFVSQFMQQILHSGDTSSFSEGILQLLDTKDRKSKESFLFLMTKSMSENILKHVSRVLELTREQQTETLFGICEHASVASMLFFLRQYKTFDFNIKNDSSQTPLMLAATKGSEHFLNLLLERNADVGKQDKHGNTVLHNICRYDMKGCGGIVKLLIDKGADVNQECSKYPYLPLQTACYEGQIHVAVALLDCGVDINSTNRYGETPLYYASWMRHTDIVTFLLQRGADVNKIGITGDSCLHAVCSEGHTDILSLLIDRDADINITNSSGDTPLHKASVGGHVDVVTELLTRGADADKKNNDGITSLRRACELGCIVIVDALVKKGVDINSTNINGSTPLHGACYRGHEEIVTSLLTLEADVNQQDNNGETPLHAAAFEGNVDVMRVLLDHGATINAINSAGDTPLNDACSEAYEDAVAVLLDRDADVNKANHVGDTPLHEACIFGYFGIVTLLIDKGADIHVVNIKHGNTPLHRACSGGFDGVVAVLLDRGADINNQNRFGCTPLHRAVHWGHASVVEVLLRRNADVNIANDEGVKPLEINVCDALSR